MSSKFAAAFLAILGLAMAASQKWQTALPGYHFQFPRDHFSHDDFQTEWWYFTGNLKSADGRRFGFELTFFRQAVRLPETHSDLLSKSVWRPDQTYLAHLALSDIDGHKFINTDRLNRAGPGLAGASLTDSKIWNGNWHVLWNRNGSREQKLEAVCDQFSLTLDLSPAKPLVIHGVNGVSMKGPEPGQASHYISFSRLSARGALTLAGETYKLTGTTWMDHEFFTENLDETLAGWDWFAIQLNNNEELMLYRLRNKAGQAERFSSGTYIDAQGRGHTLDSNQFTLAPMEWWTSPRSKARYPIGWHISIPTLGLDLDERTPLKQQEMLAGRGVSPGYWEGAVDYNGTLRGAGIKGVGYLEMTGYAAPFHIGY